MVPKTEHTLSNPANFLKAVKKSPEDFFVIHYSCQSLYDDNQELSPRITSIVVSNYGSEEQVSFSTHAIAEELGFSREEVVPNLAAIERRLLDKFNDFIRDRRDKYWLHWNMRNLTFGFEHIAHRYRVLGGERPVEIPMERRLNLNDLLARYFGADYARHPKLSSLMELNGGIHRHFLTGQQEVEAFGNREFIRMHSSTQCKVGFFVSVVRRWSSGRLKTNSRGWGVRLDRLFDSRVAKVISLIGTVIGIVATVTQFA